MRKYTLIIAGLLLSVVLGATVFSTPLAWAAQAVNATITGPLDANGNVKIHEQGTANVNVTNSSLSIAPRSAVTSGSFSLSMGCPQTADGFDTTASALSIHMTDGVAYLALHHTSDSGLPPAQFYGPANDGNSSIDLALERPIRFDSVSCSGSGSVSVGTVGNLP